MGPLEDAARAHLVAARLEAHVCRALRQADRAVLTLFGGQVGEGAALGTRHSARRQSARVSVAAAKRGKGFDLALEVE